MHGGVVRKQALHHEQLALLRGKEQRRDTVLPGVVHGGAVCKEALHHVQVPPLRGD